MPLRHLPINAAFSPRVVGLRVSDWSAQLRARIRSRFLVPADTNGACILLRQAAVAATTANMVGQQRRMATSPALPARLFSLSLFLARSFLSPCEKRSDADERTSTEYRKLSSRDVAPRYRSGCSPYRVFPAAHDLDSPLLSR